MAHLVAFEQTYSLDEVFNHFLPVAQALDGDPDHLSIEEATLLGTTLIEADAGVVGKFTQAEIDDIQRRFGEYAQQLQELEETAVRSDADRHTIRNSGIYDLAIKGTKRLAGIAANIEMYFRNLAEQNDITTTKVDYRKWDGGDALPRLTLEVGRSTAYASNGVLLLAPRVVFVELTDLAQELYLKSVGEEAAKEGAEYTLAVDAEGELHVFVYHPLPNACLLFSEDIIVPKEITADYLREKLSDPFPFLEDCAEPRTVEPMYSPLPLSSPSFPRVIKI